MRKKPPNWTKLAADAFKLGVTANGVIAFRLAKLARGGGAARRESKRMISEKVAAAQTAWLAAARDASTAQAHKTPERTMAIYQKRVSRNLRRLTKMV